MLKFEDSGRFVFDTVDGAVGLGWTKKGVRQLVLGLDTEKTTEELNKYCSDLPEVRKPRGEISRLVKRIKSHLKGRNDDFLDVPVQYPRRGDFSVAVLRRLRKVLPGEVVTYGGLAALCGKPGAARAVGGIMGSNPVPLIIPCHRCMGKDGSLTGFSSQGGIDFKARMLFKEGYVANEEHAAGLAHLRKTEPLLRKIIKKIGPYRALPDKPKPPWESLVTAIVHQQLSVKAGQTIAGRVQNLAPGPGFPTPAEVIRLKHEDLRGAGLSNQKVSYVQDLAAKVDSGELNLARLRRMDDEAVITELTKVRGIGRWSAQMHLIFHLGRLDVLPTGDLGLQMAVARGFGLDEYATPAQMEQIGAKWAPYRSMASWYLWQGLDAGGI
jgi:O-6-methylguanine DNA methyltransferase